jgi:CheY-like chemotaxis protein
MYAEYFRHQGWRVITVSVADDALRVASTATVIVTGILLPGPMDGVEFICHLKADYRTKSTPVIVLTTCAWGRERDRAEKAGCDAFLSKPCLPADLAGVVRRVLALGRVQTPRPSVPPAAAFRTRRTS